MASLPDTVTKIPDQRGIWIDSDAFFLPRLAPGLSPSKGFSGTRSLLDLATRLDRDGTNLAICRDILHQDTFNTGAFLLRRCSWQFYGAIH